MKPVVDRLEQRYTGQVTFYIYAEADKNQEAGEFASKQGVKAVPTMVVVSDRGRELERWVGTTPEPEIAASLDDALAP